MEKDIEAVLITRTKIEYFLTEKQVENINIKINHGERDFDIMVDGKICKVIISNIADIISLKKYYESFPDKRPPITDRYKTLPGMGMENIIRKSRIDVLENIRIGLNKFCQKNPEKEKSKELLQSIDKRIIQFQTNVE